MGKDHSVITYTINRCLHSHCGALLAVATLLSAVHGAQTAPPPSTSSRPAPVVTHQRMFSIPFFLNRSAALPAEVLLYASGDGGETWRIYQRQPPTATKFDFRAGEDGEFWFCVRTDPNQNRPDESTSPEKIVIVDSQQPKIQGSLSLTPAQQLTVQWRVDDAFLASTTFSVHYRSTETPQWRPVPIRQQDDYRVGEPFVGQATWTLAERSGEVEVRLTVADRAGNSAEFLDKIEVGTAHPAVPPANTTFWRTVRCGAA